MDDVSTELATFVRRSKKPLSTTPPLPASQGQAPGDGENALPLHCRFADLRAAGLVSSWPQLYRLINEQGFPAGKVLSPQVRVFPIAEVKRWLATRPVTNTRKNT